MAAKKQRSLWVPITTEIAQLTKWLASVGATDITVYGDEGAVNFTHYGDRITIYGVWHNDSTAGLGFVKKDGAKVSAHATRQQVLQEARDAIVAWIKPGDLGGNGCDLNAQRNGMTLAVYIIDGLMEDGSQEH